MRDSDAGRKNNTHTYIYIYHMEYIGNIIHNGNNYGNIIYIYILGGSFWATHRSKIEHTLESLERCGKSHRTSILVAHFWESYFGIIYCTWFIWDKLGPWMSMAFFFNTYSVMGYRVIKVFFMTQV
jgi:hypothetical protein